MRREDNFRETAMMAEIAAGMETHQEHNLSHQGRENLRHVSESRTLVKSFSTFINDFLSLQLRFIGGRTGQASKQT